MLKVAKNINCKWEQTRSIALLYVLRDTGGRCGAISRIGLENLDLMAGAVIVLDKGDNFSWLFFNPVTIQVIQKWLQFRKTNHCYDNTLFLNTKGYALSKTGIRRRLNQLAEEAGIAHERHNPHSFRHAFARDTLLAGADLSQTSQLMNHSTIVTTAKYYARWSKKELVEIHHKYSPMNGHE